MNTQRVATHCSKLVQVVSLTAGIAIAMLPNAVLAQTFVVDIATDTTDPTNRADTEPSIAVNPADPQEIAIVSFSEAWGPTNMAPVWKSRDGGQTWQKIFQIPQPTIPSPIPGQPPIGLSGPADQKIQFDRAGNLFIAELGLGGGTNNFIYRQTGAVDAPLTPGAAYGDDQPHLDVDHTAPGQPCSGRVYSPWLDFAVSPPRSNVSESSNQGVTLTDVATGDPTVPNRTTRIALSLDGRGYIVYKTRDGTVAGVSLPGSTNNDFENVHFRVARTDDCGVTWTALGATGVSIHGTSAVQTLFTNNFGVTGTGRKVARARSSDAWIAVDPSDGDVYVGYVSRDASGFAQIYVARSTDLGATWTSNRVTDGTHHSGFPEIAVAGNGTVGVLYVDFEDTGTGTTFRHRFARSFDDGVNWNDQILQSMDPQPIANAASGFLWGDYEGLTAHGDMFYGVFTGQSTGRTTLQLDPIFFRVGVGNLIVSKTNPSLCMGVKHMVSEGANVQLFSCTATDVHKNWQIISSERHICQNEESGTVDCIDFRAGAVDAVVTERADFKNNQRWLYSATDQKFHNNDPSLCLDVETQAENSQVKVFPCADFKKFQEWEIK